MTSSEACDIALEAISKNWTWTTWNSPFVAALRELEFELLPWPADKPRPPGIIEAPHPVLDGKTEWQVPSLVVRAVEEERATFERLRAKEPT